MDLLYRAYSSPMELMRTYINRGRFGDFVQGFLQAEYDRRKIEADKDEEWHLWIAYVHSYSDKSFAEWKNQLLGRSDAKKKTGGDYNLTNEGIKAILNDVFPSSTTKG